MYVNKIGRIALPMKNTVVSQTSYLSVVSKGVVYIAKGWLIYLRCANLLDKEPLVLEIGGSTNVKKRTRK